MKSLYQDSQLNGWLPGLAALSRLDAVEADLIALDKPLPEKPPAVSPQSPYAALGWLYCCEGSNIGAAFLAKEVEAIGLNEAHGAAHLASPPQAVADKRFPRGTSETRFCQMFPRVPRDGF